MKDFFTEYKETGLQWLPLMPRHWKLMRAKQLFEKMGRPVREEDEVITCFRDGHVTLRKNRNSNSYIESLRELGYQGIRKGDLVIHAMDAYEGAVGVSDSDGKGTPAYNVCTPRKDSNNYYYAYLLREMARSGYIQSLSRGIRENTSEFSFDVFGRLLLPVPPRCEQDRIAEFLMEKTDKLDRLIQMRKKQAELLYEQKQIIAGRIMMRGLDDTVKMKDSGIEGLGRIPEHWTVRKLRSCLSAVSLKNRPDLQLLSIVREKGVVIRDMTSLSNNYNSISEDLSVYKVARKGQFVVNKMKAWQGAYGVTEYTGLVSPFYLVFDVAIENQEYFHHAIRSRMYIDFFARASEGVRSRQWDLDYQKMKEIPFCVPPQGEQTAIAHYIRGAFSHYDRTIQTLTEQVDLLSDYRARLISNAVAGKMKIEKEFLPDGPAST